MRFQRQEIKRIIVRKQTAFFPDEFARMKDELYKFDTKCKDEEDKWKKRWFIHYILFQYQLGSRPHETALIRCVEQESKRELMANSSES